jgi:hypothetical protein
MRHVLSVLLLLATACGSQTTGSGFNSGKDGGTGGTDPGDDPGDFGSADGGGLGADGCSEAAKLVYVVSAENDLYSFRPDKLQFTRIGPLRCSSGGTPNSMAVARDGTAWVNYSDGRVFKVSTADASCQTTTFQPRQSGFGSRFGMGFSSDAPGAKEETLFIADVESQAGLGKIDLGTMRVIPVGRFPGGLSVGGELTGSGDGRLWGFFTTTPNATFAQITKTTGQTTDGRALQGVQTGTHWAFSFWGGDFWFYTANTTTNPSATSSVTRMNTQSNNSLGVVLQNIGFRIVGAGVSTCAPTTSPR